ncbi:MAG: hypothetical protein Q9188_003169 [Gyalolechia gomerana]
MPGSPAIVGTVEELGASHRTSALIRDQFETNYFGHVNIIKAALPLMRDNHCGHIILLTGITYEVAPFNIKVTILQPNIEISVLTNQITIAAQLPQYRPENNSAPLFREIIGGILDRLASTIQDESASNGRLKPSFRLRPDQIVSIYPQLSEQMKVRLLAETIHGLTAIGGHDNPPARHIVGHEAVGIVKEKLKTVSEELEEFVEVSCAVDIDGEIPSPRQD